MSDWDPAVEEVVIAVRQQTEAIDRVAYELHTSNLIALWTAPAKNAEGIYDKGEELAGVSYGRIADQIKERLGLA